MAARSWLRRQRDRGNLAAVVLVGCLVFILPGVPLWLRIPLALLAGVVFRKEMDWERRSPANLRRASRLLAVTTGWWISTFGLMCALVALTPVVHGWGTRALLLVAGAVLFVVGLPGLLAAVSVLRRRD